MMIISIRRVTFELVVAILAGLYALPRLMPPFDPGFEC